MTHQDYELIAKVIRNAGLSKKARHHLTGAFADALWEEVLVSGNGRFNREKFVRACLPDVVRALRELPSAGK